MKVFVFIRGPQSELKDEVLRALLVELNPGTFLNVSLDEFDPENKKNAHRLSKIAIREALKWDQPHCFIIQNPSLNPPDWDSYLALATPNTVSIGIDVYSQKDEYSNLQLRNVREFIVSTYKYLCVKLNEDIPGVIREATRIIHRGDTNVFGRGIGERSND